MAGCDGQEKGLFLPEGVLSNRESQRDARYHLQRPLYRQRTTGRRYYLSEASNAPHHLLATSDTDVPCLRSFPRASFQVRRS